MKHFWVRVTGHPEFPDRNLHVRADLSGHGHPPVGEEFAARLLDVWGRGIDPFYTPLRLRLTGRAPGLGNTPVWFAEVVSGGPKSVEPPQPTLFLEG